VPVTVPGDGSHYLTGLNAKSIQGSSIPTPAMHEAFKPKNRVDQNPS